MTVRFDWNDAKNRANIRKHGVSFEEASTVCFDENALLMQDPDHSQEEDRFLLLGFSSRLRVLIVAHCYRAEDQLIRIISAMKAERSEREQYWSRLR